jgi:predicted RNA-binding protein YlxR (DUF448 family)
MHVSAGDHHTDDRRALQRLCAATRVVRPVGELIRFVVSPDGVLTPDLKRKLPGRGVWVTATRAALLDALRKKAFTRSLKTPVEVPPDLVPMVEQLIERSALDMLAMANKAGLVVAGFAKVLERIEGRRAAAVIQACEGAPDGARKLAAAIRRSYVNEEPPAFITNFSSAHLDLALGRANVIHAALGAGPATTGFLIRVAALAFWHDGELATAKLAGAAESRPRAADEPSTRDARPATDGTLTLDGIPGRPAGFGTE